MSVAAAINVAISEAVPDNEVTAAALIAYSLKSETFDKIVYLMNVESCKFRSPVLPEMKVRANVES